MAKTPVGRKRTAASSTSTAAKTPRATPAKSASARTAVKSKTTKGPRLPKQVAAAVKAAQEKQAENIVVLDLRQSGGFTDHFVICTGGNPRQIVAIADAIREHLKRDFGERPTVAEGLDKAEWVLLDYFDFVVHIFSRDCRTFYNLEKLWGNAERRTAEEEEAVEA